MWKEKMPNGKIKYGTRYTDPLTGESKRIFITKVSAGRKVDDRAAERELDDKIKDILARYGKIEDLTFKELVQRRVEWQFKHDKPQTATASAYFLSTLTKRIGARTKVNNLTAAAVSDFLSSDTPTTYNERLKHYKALIRWGYRNDLVKDISYLDKLQKMKEPSVREKDKFKYMEHDELNLVLSHMKIEKWKLLTEFLALTGCRIGEAIALNDDDLDLEAREITINKTYAYTIGQLSSAKTDASHRVIFIQDELIACIKKMRNLIREEKLMFRYRSNIFVPDIDGGYISYYAYAKYLKENTAAVIGRTLSPHSLRHTHTSMLAESGVPLETISRRLGHADSKITREIYLHVTEKMKDKDNEFINKVSILG